MPELGGEGLSELGQRGPRAVQALQHDGGAVGEVPADAVVADLVADAGSHAAPQGERRFGQGGAALGHPQERGPQPAVGDQLVDRVEGEQVREVVPRAVGARRQERSDAPRPGELIEPRPEEPPERGAGVLQGHASEEP